MHIHMCIRRRTQTCAHTHTHTHTRTYRHTRIHAHTHTNTLTHAFAFTRTLIKHTTWHARDVPVGAPVVKGQKVLALPSLGEMRRGLELEARLQQQTQRVQQLLPLQLPSILGSFVACLHSWRSAAPPAPVAARGRAIGVGGVGVVHDAHTETDQRPEHSVDLRHLHARHTHECDDVSATKPRVGQYSQC